MTEGISDARLAEFARRRDHALAMGGEEKLAKRRAQGLMNARERLEYLLDPRSFTESGLFATSARPEMRDRTPTDGKVAGFGTVDGRPIGVVSNDFTVLGSSSGLVNSKKMRHIKEVAASRGFPLVLLGESTGSRIPDRMGAAGRAILGQDPYEYRRLRETPWISALLGPCYGSSTWYAAMSDFVVMRKGATMAVASSRVTSIATSEDLDPEILGGWKLHTEVSGLVDVAVDTDATAIDVVKRFLSYMPSNCNERPPVADVPSDSGTRMERILDIVPEGRAQVYDMRKVVDAIADSGSAFEMKPRFARNLITALVRLDGQVVGIIANNPMFKAGAIDPAATGKGTSFMVLCDTFNIPLVLLVDQPGFLVGLEGEKQAMPGRIMNWMNALSLVSVPKLSVILRKSYGQAYLNMGGGRNSNEVAVWPSADLGFMDPRVSVNILHGIREQEDPKRFEELVAEVARDSSGWELAALYEAQSAIDPRETREYLISMLRVHELRRTNGIGEHLLCNWPTSYY